MAEINLTRKKKQPPATLTINLAKEGTEETEKFEYLVDRLGGRAAMEVQMLNAEFAREKDRNTITGSILIKKILEGTKPKGKSPELLDLFDELDDAQLGQVVEGLVKAAKSSTVTAE